MTAPAPHFDDNRSADRLWARLMLASGALPLIGLGMFPYLLSLPRSGRRTALVALAVAAVTGVAGAVLLFGRDRTRDAVSRRRVFFRVGMLLAPLLIAGILIDGGVGSPVALALLPPSVLAAAAFPLRDALWHLVPIVGGYTMAWLLGPPAPVWVVALGAGLFLSTVVPVAVVRSATLRYGVDQEDRARSLERLTATDGLTGCHNHRSFHDLLHAAMEDGGAEEGQPSLILLDVDHFKHVNDTFGHVAGDRALAMVGATLRDCTRRGDVVARIGGEEFAVLLPGVDVGRASEVAERIRQRIAATVVQGVRVTVSCGVGGRRAGETAAQFRRRVDGLLYDAKHAGRDVVVAQPATASSLAGLS